MPRIGKAIEKECRFTGNPELGSLGREWGVTTNGSGRFLWGGENVLTLIVVMVAQV